MRRRGPKPVQERGLTKEKQRLMRIAYIARETLAPGASAEEVDALVDFMTKVLEDRGYEVEVGDFYREQDDETGDDVTEAWVLACDSVEPVEQDFDDLND